MYRTANSSFQVWLRRATLKSAFTCSGPCSTKRPNRLDPPGPPCSQSSTGTSVLPDCDKKIIWVLGEGLCQFRQVTYQCWEKPKEKIGIVCLVDGEKARVALDLWSISGQTRHLTQLSAFCQFASFNVRRKVKGTCGRRIFRKVSKLIGWCRRRKEIASEQGTAQGEAECQSGKGQERSHVCRRMRQVKRESMLEKEQPCVVVLTLYQSHEPQTSISNRARW